jgi:tetratricopeptide (TPR) repeat protein
MPFKNRLERHEESIQKLTFAYQLEPSFLDALLSRGNVFVDFGNQEAFQKAQADYFLVLRINPRNIDAHINLAYLYQITGLFQKAWDLFTLAIEFEPKLPSLYEGRSIVSLQMSDMSAALKDINQAIDIARTAELYVNRGVIYQFMSDNLNAMRDYQSAILLDPSYGLAYFNSANVYLIHKQYSQALNSLDTAIEKCFMKDDSTLQNRAIVKALIGDSIGAFRDFCEAMRFNKYSAHIYMNRSLLLYKLGNFYLAEKDVNNGNFRNY